jgi:hypothetical protein
MSYKWIRLNELVLRLADGANIPATNDNLDWVAFQKWLAEGNTPQAADPVPAPVPPKSFADQIVGMSPADRARVRAVFV